MKTLNVWSEPLPAMVEEQLQFEAKKLFVTHQLPTQLSVWEKMRDELRKRIWRSMGTKPNHALSLDLKIHKTTQMEGYKVQNITYQSRPDFYVTANLYIPDQEKIMPGVISMHGHYNQGRLFERVQARGHSLAKNGYVSLCVDAMGSGERSTLHGDYEYHGANLGVSLFDIGETLMGMQVVDNMRGVDLLCSLDFVDSEKIGATGASGGGNQTMWIAAMDERIKSAVPVVSVGTFESYIGAANCICEVLPNGLTFTEESGILALVAPRALKICNALKDCNRTFFAEEMLRSFKEARKVFKLYDKDQSFAYQNFNVEHGYWPEIREAMLGWFDMTLKSEGAGRAREEIPFETLEEEELICFPKGKRPQIVLSIAEYCRQQGTLLREEVLESIDIDVAAKKEELGKLLKIDTSLLLTKCTEHEYMEFDGRQWRKMTLEITNGRLIPILFFDNSANKQVSEITILTHADGKDSLIDSTVLKRVYKENCSILIADLSCTGETLNKDDKIAKHHNISRSCWWLGKTLMGEWVSELNFLYKFALTDLKASAVNLVGVKENGLASLFCSLFIDSSLKLRLYNSPTSYCFADQPTQLSMGMHLPGMLKWGDLSLVAALGANDVVFVSPCRMDQVPCDKSEAETFIAEIELLSQKTGKQGTYKVEYEEV